MVIAHLLLLAASFFALFQFGIELLLPRLPHHRWLRALPGAVLLLWGVGVSLWGVLAGEPLNILFAIGDAWSRYFLCFPGALLASLGLMHQARQMRSLNLERISLYLNGAAIAFAVYALVGGLMVPSAPVFPANWFNYALLDRIIHIPAPVFRSLCGMAIAFFVLRSLEVFQVETDRRLAEMEQAQILATDRERIGRELHDGIIQSIYAAGLNLEDARHLIVENPAQSQQRIQSVMAALNQTIEDIRRYIFDLQAVEQTRELEKILEDLVHDLRLDTMLEIDLEVTGQRCCWLDMQQVAHITQIAREALSNVVQHAEASHVTVSLSYLGYATRLAVADNGRGASLDSLGKDDHEYLSQGIANMQARARLMDGLLDLDSRPGEGFRLVLTIPCHNGETPVTALGSEVTA
jgi:signal transduction histidine kinase